MREYIVSRDTAYEFEMGRFEELQELIRCKYCKYWWKEYELCKHPKTCEECGPDFYCGYAERKDNDCKNSDK